LNGTDNGRVENYENKSLSTPMGMHHIHLWVPDPIAAQKWYVQHFGATAGKRAQFETANVPGTEITFNKVDKPQAATKGRPIDHIGFKGREIAAYVPTLAAA